MIILYTFPYASTVFTVLWISLGILVAFILYRQLLRWLGKGRPAPENYCVLYDLEIQPVTGEVPFYFTAEQVKSYRLVILDPNLDEVLTVAEKECHTGGNIVRFDASQLANGEYFYCLKTSNQKTMKKMEVKHA